jgi:hypothetical protein
MLWKVWGVSCHFRRELAIVMALTAPGEKWGGMIAPKI